MLKVLLIDCKNNYIKTWHDTYATNFVNNYASLYYYFKIRYFFATSYECKYTKWFS